MYIDINARIPSSEVNVNRTRAQIDPFTTLFYSCMITLVLLSREQAGEMRSISPDFGILAGGAEVTLTGRYLAAYQTVIISNSETEFDSGNTSAIEVQVLTR